MNHEDETAAPAPLGQVERGVRPASEASWIVEELAHRTAWRYAHSRDPHHSHTYTFNSACLLDFADRLLAAERERCAKVCESLEDAFSDSRRDPAEFAAAIRSLRA